ncbi:deoxyribodipyrimidine photolyase [Labrenzia sp. R4_1]|nr:deoxyribodipyrimidine photolyase [Labrenzia sp. R4_1]
MGRAYATQRNYDRGPGKHTSVSCLSPFIRRRLISEQEVVTAALQNHGLDGAEKFIQEVFWRGYFKGWLERRPAIWTSYQQGLTADLEDLEKNSGLRQAVTRAEAGQTGIDCFDAWVDELVHTGYLHNHARMWFASIWIFTLKLPWRIGADFFYRHLLDGDPASNTLSWRWVAGLHTRGKTYEAQAWNIAKFTGGRFAPESSDFETGVTSLDWSEPNGLPSAQPTRDFVAPEPGKPTALLLTEDDCLPETLIPDGIDLVAAAALTSSDLRSPRPVPDHIRSFEAGALEDAAQRIGQAATRLNTASPVPIIEWAAEAGAKQIVIPYVPAGPLKDWLDASRPKLENHGLTLTEIRRPWDDAIWRYATAGFFKVKKEIPNILNRLEIV